MAKDGLSTKTKIGIGSKVLVRLNKNRILTITIKTPDEVDPDNGVVSFRSPLGKALLGKQDGDVCKYFIGKRELVVKVLKIYQ